MRVIIGLFIFVSIYFAFSGNARALELSGLPVAIKGAKYVGTDTCASCHDKEYKEFKLSMHARVSPKDVPDGVSTGCEMCHGPGSVHVDNGGGKGNIINPAKNPQSCFTCHTDKKMEFRLPYHHPVLEGKMSCTDCHDPHGIDVLPWTATSERDVNEVCFKCHNDKRGPFIWKHDALREGCTVCHKVHGSINDKMLIARDVNLCLRCHATVNFPFMQSDNHTMHLPYGTCWSAGCHQAVHGSNMSNHLNY